MSNSYSPSNVSSDEEDYDNNSIDNINDVILEDDNKDDYMCKVCEDDTEYNNIFIDSESKILNTKSKYISNEERITKNKITKYEKVRILGLRIKQLSLGAKPLIKHDNILNLTPQEIAMLEYKNKTIPFKIRRPLPNNTYELWKFSELV